MDWRQQWKPIAIRLAAWRRAAESYLGAVDLFQLQKARATDLLVKSAQEIRTRIAALPLPPSLKASLDAMAHDTGVVGRVVEGHAGVMHQMLVLDMLAIPIVEAYASNDTAQRTLVERAFVHLSRTLAVDADARARWIAAFAKGETACEQLGGVHLLQHGVYSFKADAVTGRTDLILQSPLKVDDEVLAASALVLTEWKLVGADAEVPTKAREGLLQAERYGANEVAGLELRTTRYVVLVSRRGFARPHDEVRGDVTYRFINIAVDAETPSAESRRRRRG